VLSIIGLLMKVVFVNTFPLNQKFLLKLEYQLIPFFFIRVTTNAGLASIRAWMSVMDLEIWYYATEEKYGFIWIYPDAEAPEEVPNFDELKDKEILTQTDCSFTRTCHHHICMMNGIDIQHLKTIHHLDIKMELSLNFPGKLVHKLTLPSGDNFHKLLGEKG
jgi:hypothetical protein